MNRFEALKNIENDIGFSKIGKQPGFKYKHSVNMQQLGGELHDSKKHNKRETRYFIIGHAWEESGCEALVLGC